MQKESLFSFLWDLTWSPASSSGALSTGKTWTCWTGSCRDRTKCSGFKL